MSRYIDADEFKRINKRLLHCDFPYLCELTLEELLDEIPTVDAVPVVHGHWIIEDIPGTCWYRVTCSECGENVTSFANIYVGTGCGFNYCPECGAKMDEVTE